jgi:hypothetical protein
MSLIRTVPDTRPRHRHDPSERPAPRIQVSYRCSRENHDFTITLAAGAEPPAVWDCRCGARSHRVESTNVVTTESTNVVAVSNAEAEHERHRELVHDRRTPAEAEEILAEALAGAAAARQAGTPPRGTPRNTIRSNPGRTRP